MTDDIRTRAARSVADVTQGTILATVDIAAPPERVYRALTDPREILRWWGSDDMYRTTSWTSDLRVHGRWRAEGKGADGHAFSVQGEFIELDPPHTLVQTWQPDWDAGAVTTLTYRLAAIEGGTRLTVRHEGFAGRPESCANHAQGWEHVLGWLTAHLTPPSAAEPAPRYFFSKLLPPRPSFAFDMSAAERELMQQHAAYWRALLARGQVIVFGPVADPAGVHGISVVRAADEVAMHALASADPAIQSGMGFRYETAPMLSVVFRVFRE
jgi:uncharacterized protein YndB with AHSA1/START domain